MNQRSKTTHWLLHHPQPLDQKNYPQPLDDNPKTQSHRQISRKKISISISKAQEREEQIKSLFVSLFPPFVSIRLLMNQKIHNYNYPFSINQPIHSLHSIDPSSHNLSQIHSPIPPSLLIGFAFDSNNNLLKKFPSFLLYHSLIHSLSLLDWFLNSSWYLFKTQIEIRVDCNGERWRRFEFPSQNYSNWCAGDHGVSGGEEARPPAGFQHCWWRCLD